MDAKERDALVGAINQWASKHPTPDLPVMSFAADENYTPQQIYLEILERTAFGRWFERMIDEGITTEAYSFDDVLGGFVGGKGFRGWRE